MCSRSPKNGVRQLKSKLRISRPPVYLLQWHHLCTHSGNVPTHKPGPGVFFFVLIPEAASPSFRHLFHFLGMCFVHMPSLALRSPSTKQALLIETLTILDDPGKSHFYECLFDRPLKPLWHSIPFIHIAYHCTFLNFYFKLVLLFYLLPYIPDYRPQEGRENTPTHLLCQQCFAWYQGLSASWVSE